MSQENQDYCCFDIQGLEGMGIIFNGKRVVLPVYLFIQKMNAAPKGGIHFLRGKEANGIAK